MNTIQIIANSPPNCHAVQLHKKVVESSAESSKQITRRRPVVPFPQGLLSPRRRFGNFAMALVDGTACGWKRLHPEDIALFLGELKVWHLVER